MNNQDIQWAFRCGAITDQEANEMEGEQMDRLAGEISELKVHDRVLSPEELQGMRDDVGGISKEQAAFDTWAKSRGAFPDRWPIRQASLAWAARGEWEREQRSRGEWNLCNEFQERAEKAEAEEAEQRSRLHAIQGRFRQLILQYRASEGAWENQVNDICGENELLAGELEDYRHDYAQAMQENPDEQHCSCVPPLKRRIRELQTELPTLAAALQDLKEATLENIGTGSAGEKVSEACSEVNDLLAKKKLFRPCDCDGWKAAEQKRSAGYVSTHAKVDKWNVVHMRRVVLKRWVNVIPSGDQYHTATFITREEAEGWAEDSTCIATVLVEIPFYVEDTPNRDREH